MKPSIGCIVHYRLSEQDAEIINRRRPNGSAGQDGAGSVVHVGNPARVGAVCPAMIVQTFGGTTVNLQVVLDGNDTYWATSRSEGDAGGTWAWPPRV